VAHELNYSRFDRLVHRIAFAAPFVQLTAADIEHVLYGESYKHVAARRPIFVTSLPRAGTTVLLEALSQFPSLASHVYRDMPFVMAPVLWSRLSGPFHQPQELEERAHGDGLEVGFDSPEAFEEILWRSFWPQKYGRHGIALWGARDFRREARAFFMNHMKKIVALRRPDRAADGRYLSKNNANIARLDLIGRMFPDAFILLPFRRPLEHATSLLRQHLRFLEMQKDEPFVGRYMADIGHYEFGKVHRPLAFPGLDELTSHRDPATLDYWLGYWVATFEYVLGYRARLVVMSYEDACTNPSRALGAVCARLEIAEEGALPLAAARFKAAPPARANDADVDGDLRARAEGVYDALMAERLS
jgi:hypothetical protein